MKQRVVVTGATGFIGTQLCKQLAMNGYHVVAIGHTTPVAQTKDDGMTIVAWDGVSAERIMPYVDGAYGIVNLAGENIGSSAWNEQKKKAIFDSRLSVGQALVAAVKNAKKKPQVLIQASAVGFYHTSEEVIDEEGTAGNGFLANVCKHWEASTKPVERMKVRHVIIRSGVVLGKGGMLSKITGPFKWGLGGTIGNGNQWMSFIHIQDEIDAIEFLLEDKKLKGVFNLCAPHPATNREFTQALAKSLHRPSWFGLSGFILRARYGEMAEETILASHRVVPHKLEKAGFLFSYPTVESALENILEGKE
jgi:uncharacterized protein